MRIGLDVRALQTGGGSATRGIGRYVTDLLEGLLASFPEDDLVLLALKGRPLPNDWAERCEIVPVEGLVYHEMPKPFYMRLPKVRSNQALLGRLHYRAVASQRAGLEAAVREARLDILHLPTALDVGSYPEGTFDVPVVATFLDAIPLVHRETYYDVWGSFLQRFYDRQMSDLRKAAHVVAISEASRIDAIRYAGLSPDRVSVVYPSISTAFYEPAETVATRKRYGLEGPFVLFCSVPDPHKNPERVVAAFAKADLEGVTLAFVSPREEPHLGNLRGFAARHGVAEDRLVVTGRVSDGELVALFQSALLLASPSLIEGFGLPAAQALAAGIPTLVSSRGSQPEVVGDAGLIVDPEDVDAIARAMARLGTDGELRRDLIERGKRRAELFRPERQAEAIRAVYERAATGL